MTSYKRSQESLRSSWISEDQGKAVDALTTAVQHTRAALASMRKQPAQWQVNHFNLVKLQEARANALQIADDLAQLIGFAAPKTS